MTGVSINARRADISTVESALAVSRAGREQTDPGENPRSKEAEVSCWLASCLSDSSTSMLMSEGDTCMTSSVGVTSPLE